MVYTANMELQIGVKALIKGEGDRFLFLKRAQPVVQGRITWDIPGGRINKDEPLLTGLAREIMEETGIAMPTEDAWLINAQDIFVKEKELRVVRLTYLIGVHAIAITLSDEHSEYAFFTLQEALDIVDEPELRATLEMLL